MNCTAAHPCRGPRLCLACRCYGARDNVLALAERKEEDVDRTPPPVPYGEAA